MTAVKRFTDAFEVSGVYRLRETSLGIPADVTSLREDIEAIVHHWRSKEIEPGSSEALQVDH